MPPHTLDILLCNARRPTLGGRCTPPADAHRRSDKPGSKSLAGSANGTVRTCGFLAQYRLNQRSCPLYARLQLLLHTGKSEIAFWRLASSMASQLWKDG